MASSLVVFARPNSISLIIFEVVRLLTILKVGAGNLRLKRLTNNQPKLHQMDISPTRSYVCRGKINCRNWPCIKKSGQEILIPDKTIFDVYKPEPNIGKAFHNFKETTFLGTLLILCDSTSLSTRKSVPISEPLRILAQILSRPIYFAMNNKLDITNID